MRGELPLSDKQVQNLIISRRMATAGRVSACVRAGTHWRVGIIGQEPNVTSFVIVDGWLGSLDSPLKIEGKIPK